MSNLANEFSIHDFDQDSTTWPDLVLHSQIIWKKIINKGIRVCTRDKKHGGGTILVAYCDDQCIKFLLDDDAKAELIRWLQHESPVLEGEDA